MVTRKKLLIEEQNKELIMLNNLKIILAIINIL